MQVDQAVNQSVFDTNTLIVYIFALVVVAIISLGLIYIAGKLLPLIRGMFKYRNREQYSLDHVLLEVTVPRANEHKIDAAEQLFNSLYFLKRALGKFSSFKMQEQISFEIVGLKENIRFYISVHKKHRDLVEKQFNGAYPDAKIVEVDEYNIFSESGKSAYSMMGLKSASHFPIKTYKDLPTDPLAAITTAIGKMEEGEGASIQILLSPADNKWKDAGKKFLKKEKDPGTADKPKAAPDAKQLDAVETKIAKSGFEFVIRIVTTSTDKARAKEHLNILKSTLEQFAGPYNQFSGMKIYNGPIYWMYRQIITFDTFWKKIVLGQKNVGNIFKTIDELFITDFIYRYFPMFDNLSVMTADEIASVFHIPNKSVETPHIQFLPAKVAPASDKIPSSGLYLGKSLFRGIERPVYIGDSDRQRHMYIIGRTGTGKTMFLETLAYQDILSGKGLAFIDPHGDGAEELLNMIPPERAKDVVYWDPSDIEYPFAMNMLDYGGNDDQKGLVVEEIIGMLYKLYDPNKSGIIGPRLEHAVRNVMLTVMYIKGGSLIEVVRALQDITFVREILPDVTNPLVRRYWTDQIEKTDDFHKAETLDYFVSKFSKFVYDDLLRNIIGQSGSSIDMRDIMDNGKILLVNLAKGKLGEENSKFLGLILVPKILRAAMSRADIPEAQRRDFYLYVDEFQNFATDAFSSILAEARKYHLNLVVANQFISQLSDDIKKAIIGNIGTFMTYRIGTDDAPVISKEFEPIFNDQDLLNVPARTMYVKTQVKGEPVPAFALDVTLDLTAWKGLAHPEIGARIKDLCRKTYGRPRKDVEKEIAERAKL